MSFRRITSAFALILLFSAWPSWAQDQQQPNSAPDQQSPNNNAPTNGTPQAPVQPVAPDSTDNTTHQMPAGAARGLSGGDSNSGNDSAPISAEAQPLTGALSYGSGAPAGTHNLLDAALHVSTGGQTGLSPGVTDFLWSVGGLLGLNHTWNRYQLIVQYAGAETLYRPDSEDNSGFQDFSLSQTIRWRRTTLRLRDDFTQSSGSDFGGLTLGGPGLSLPLAGATDNLTQTFIPSETILTGPVDELSNSTLGELDYQLSRRTTLTFTGSYQLLHFLTSGYIDSQDEVGQVGYNYLLDRNDTLGLVYAYDRYDYQNDGLANFATHSVQAAYGRRLTNLTSLRISAGPQYTTNYPLSWSLNASLVHQLRRTFYSISYARTATNGSGVLLGAETQTVEASLSRVLSRTWTGSLNGGYALNNALSNSAAAAAGYSYSNWFASVNFGRLWDRIVRTNFSYELQRQSQGNASCPVLDCGTSQLYQQFAVTLDFHIRPVAIE